MKDVHLCFIVLPESIKHIGVSAFEDCSSLKRISLPYSLEHIGRNAFRHCSSLVGINIPTKVKELHAGTFAFCDNLIWAKLNTQIYYSRYFNPQVNSVFYQTHKDFQIVVPPNMLYDYKNHSSFNIYRITDKWLIPNRQIYPIFLACCNIVVLLSICNKYNKYSINYMFTIK